MAERKHFSRGLRFTLTSVYTVLFTLLLVGVGLLFRQYLKSSLKEQAFDDLNQSWAVVVANLRIENDPPERNYHALWYLDPATPDEAAISARIKDVYVVADSTGTPIPEYGLPACSPKYSALGLDSPNDVKQVLASKQPVWKEKKDPRGVRYVIRQSYVISEDRSRKAAAVHLDCR